MSVIRSIWGGGPGPRALALFALALFAGCAPAPPLAPPYNCETGVCAPKISPYAVEITAPEGGTLRGAHAMPPARWVTSRASSR